MASTTKKRLRRAAKKVERQRRAAIATRPGKTGRGRVIEPPYHFPDEPDGGTGVREPRRPSPLAPAGGMEREIPTEQRLDLSASAR
jgi:hypothetical protein